jgi:DNA topoisomerase-3
VRGNPGVARETRKPQNESAPPLFDLTTLQREANRRFGMSARNTLSAAQRLYEAHKLITYPRTDSRCLPPDYREPVQNVLRMLEEKANRPAEGFLDFPLYGRAARHLQKEGLQNQARIFDAKGVSDHFAIIPTTEVAPAGLRPDEARIYNLIVRRFLAAFYPPATWIKVERITVVAENHFRTRSRHLAKAGWYEVYERDPEAEKDRELPALAPTLVPGQDKTHDVPARNLTLEARADETRPPARINEGRLLSLMENAGKSVDDEQISRLLHEKGLGTPATRAEIIEALIARKYVERVKGALKTTTKGILLIDMLRRIEVSRLASPELTGEMEFRLHQVEEGTHKRDDYMSEIQDYTIDIVERARNFEYAGLFAEDPPLGSCPSCQVRKVREQARFYACEGNLGKGDGECGFILWKDRSGRYLDRRTVAELLSAGPSAPDPDRRMRAGARALGRRTGHPGGPPRQRGTLGRMSLPSSVSGNRDPDPLSLPGNLPREGREEGRDGPAPRGLPAGALPRGGADLYGREEDRSAGKLHLALRQAVQGLSAAQGHGQARF